MRARGRRALIGFWVETVSMLLFGGAHIFVSRNSEIPSLSLETCVRGLLSLMRPQRLFSVKSWEAERVPETSL